jgi:hypothetical protein
MAYRAEATSEWFTPIRWERSGAQPTASTLRSYRNNADDNLFTQEPFSPGQALK